MANQDGANVKVGSINVTREALLTRFDTPGYVTGKLAANLTMRYWRPDLAAIADVTESDITNLNDAHLDGGVKELSFGAYRVDWPDAAFQAGADHVWLLVRDDGAGAAQGFFQERVTLVDSPTVTEIAAEVKTQIELTLGTLATAAGTGDPDTAKTLMAYLKQLVNILAGTAGIATFPAEAAPGDGVSLSEVLRAIHSDVTGLNGSAMRGTDNAALATVATEARLAELDAANLPADLDQVKGDLPTRLTKNAALANFPFFMAQSADHITPATGLTVTAERRIDAGVFAPCANAVSEVSAGWYSINLAASDLNGDTIAFKFTAPGADPRNITIVTQPT